MVKKIPPKGTPEYKAYMREIASKGGKKSLGKKKPATIEREKVLEMAKDIIAGRTKRLIDTQYNLAMGAIKVFVIRSHWEGSGKNKRLIKEKPVIVEDEDEIANALDHEYGDGDSPNDENSYYFVMTKDPDNTAIKDLLDRTFGKATENKNITLAKSMGEELDELFK